MSSRSIAVVVIGLALIAGGVAVHHDHAQYRSDVARLDAELKATLTLSQAETERLKLLASACRQ